ncbi:MAG: RDD family protein [Candidatus Marinimicrobia bacterium]|nr:RDD family protein [Candidatus Neomarinimicrobiota bacterium]
MICPNCQKEITPDSFFCQWCGTFIPKTQKGRKANIFIRWLALVIDPLIGIGLYFLAVGIFGAISEDMAGVMAVLFPLGYFIWFLTLLRQGMTPGKKILGLQVVRNKSGEIPGFGKMFVREIFGRILSGLFFGLGYFWALFDKNSQAWHDKLAGTVVLKVSK